MKFFCHFRCTSDLFCLHLTMLQWANFVEMTPKRFCLFWPIFRHFYYSQYGERTEEIVVVHCEDVKRLCHALGDASPISLRSILQVHDTNVSHLHNVQRQFPPFVTFFPILGAIKVSKNQQNPPESQN